MSKHPLDNYHWPHSRYWPGEHSRFYCTVCRFMGETSMWNGCGLHQHLSTKKHRDNVSDPSIPNYRNVAEVEPDVYKKYLEENK
jgi:hypothetical protein